MNRLNAFFIEITILINIISSLDYIYMIEREKSKKKKMLEKKKAAAHVLKHGWFENR